MSARITIQILIPIVALCGVLLCIHQLTTLHTTIPEAHTSRAEPTAKLPTEAFIIQSPMAERLGAVDKGPEDDLQVLHDMLRYYRLGDHGTTPLGTNREITTALTTPDRYGKAYLHPRHPAINSAGQLTDRWGTPFFIHPLSRESFELRSAGPDRQLFTEDDYNWPTETPNLHVRNGRESSVTIR